jgi:hypothetical protein
MKKFNFLMVILGCTVWVSPAMAYIDPGSGSVVIQSIIAAITGGLFVLKTYWYKIKSKLFPKNKTVEIDVNDQLDN